MQNCIFIPTNDSGWNSYIYKFLTVPLDNLSLSLSKWDFVFIIYIYIYIYIYYIYESSL